MAFINPVVAHGAAVLARQLTSAVTSSLAPSSSSAPPTPLSTVASTSVSPAPSPSNTDSGNTPNGSQSSPLLFFVALGFGVVFTNLWIIVGVKYCFRYNARNRQLRLTEDGEPITLDNMPRPHRRRREKKLMTMDEVNEKFPMVKYKNWVAGRAQEGLPTRGGVSAPPSRANSVRSTEGIVPELPPKERESVDARPTTSATTTEKHEPNREPEESTSATVAELAQPSAEAQASSTAQDAPEAARASGDHTDDDEDEHINAALPPELLATSGDTCAICIDTLEDDDDVRGLTCGHAFHAVCLDPWLTSRRACCPLCKADYYTPKPRPPAPEGAEGTPGVVAVSLSPDGRHRMNMHSRPNAAWISIRGNGRMFATRFVVGGGHDSLVDRPSPRNTTSSAQRGQGGQRGLFARLRPTTTSSSQGTRVETTRANSTPAPGSGAGWLTNFRSGFPPFRLNQSRQQAQPSNPTNEPVASGANPAVSPSHLEAGVRTETR